VFTSFWHYIPGMVLSGLVGAFGLGIFGTFRGEIASADPRMKRKAKNTLTNCIMLYQKVK
jgi:hypothetical protein